MANDIILTNSIYRMFPLPSLRIKNIYYINISCFARPPLRFFRGLYLIILDVMAFIGIFPYLLYNKRILERHRYICDILEQFVLTEEHVFS